MATAFLGLILLCAGLGCLIFWGAEKAVGRLEEGIANAQRESEIASARVVLLAFLEDIQANNATQAYERGSKAFQARQTLAQWQCLLHRHPELKNMRGADLEVKSGRRTDAATCRVMLVAEDGVEVGAVVELVKDTGPWEVDRLIVH